jgi:hypothetical protein
MDKDGFISKVRWYDSIFINMQKIEMPQKIGDGLAGSE